MRITNDLIDLGDDQNPKSLYGILNQFILLDWSVFATKTVVFEGKSYVKLHRFRVVIFEDTVQAVLSRLQKVMGSSVSQVAFQTPLGLYWGKEGWVRKKVGVGLLGIVFSFVICGWVMLGGLQNRYDRLIHQQQVQLDGLLMNAKRLEGRRSQLRSHFDQFASLQILRVKKNGQVLQVIGRGDDQRFVSFKLDL